jgi:tetratricopeptide (TPR) repeat protein
MKLSLAMIVRNEAAHLGHCLDSVRGLVDELVVVDTGSSDDTVAIARERGAAVSVFPWIGDFSAARNASLAQVTGDWVLVLDADEALDPVDFPLIREALAQDQVSGFQLLIRNYLPDGNRLAMDQPAKPNPGGYTEGAAFAHCGDSRNLRLFRRLPGMAYQGRLHELMEPFFQEHGLPIAALDAVIHHYGQTLAARVEDKKPLYLALAQQDAAERPGVFEAHYNLVMQAMAAEAWTTAVAAVEELRRRFPTELPAVTFVHALSLQSLDRHEEALAAFDRLLQAAPRHATGFVRRGISLASLGRTVEARAVFLEAERLFPALAVPIVHLAELEASQGDRAAARATLLRGAARFPRDASVWTRLVRLGLDAGQTAEAVKDAWTAIHQCPGGGEGTWHQLVGLSLLQQGAEAQGRAVLRLGLRAFPGHPGLTRLSEGL